MSLWIRKQLGWKESLAVTSDPRPATHSFQLSVPIAFPVRSNSKDQFQTQVPVRERSQNHNTCVDLVWREGRYKMQSTVEAT